MVLTGAAKYGIDRCLQVRPLHTCGPKDLSSHGRTELVQSVSSSAFTLAASSACAFLGSPFSCDIFLRSSCFKLSSGWAAFTGSITLPDLSSEQHPVLLIAKL